MKYIGEIPKDLMYTKEHEWVRIEDSEGTVGITDYAQHALTDVVFVELPAIGKNVQQFKPLCIVESVKSVSDVFSPLSGNVFDVNNSITNSPESVNKEPYGNGWIAKIKIIEESETKNLMKAEDYKKYLEGLEH